MINRQHCDYCGGSGRVLPDGIEITEVTADSWIDCRGCMGTGVQMSAREFVAYVVFPDEASAWEYLRESGAPGAAIRPEQRHGITLFPNKPLDGFEVFARFEDEMDAEAFRSVHPYKANGVHRKVKG